MNHAPLPMASLVPVPRAPRSRVHAALLRRIDACAERRTAAALAPGDTPESIQTWRRERERGDKLRRALISHLNHLPESRR